MPGFSVNIGADTAQLAQGLSKAQADLLQFSNAIIVNANGAANALAGIPAALRPVNPAQMQALSNAVQRLKQDIQSAPSSINATAAAVNNLNKGLGAANGAVMDFSRVIQDLPFGMVGIVNNLQQLPGSLQRLSAASRETGKSVGSLLLSSITGVGGLGLAVAAVTSGMLIYQNGIVGFTSKTKAAKDEAQKLAELLKSVKSASESAFEGIGASQGEIIQVQALAAAVGDETRSQIERGRALEKLKSINKEYFGDLKLEEDSLRTLTPLVNEYTNALIQQAIVRELQTELGKIGATFVKQAKAVSDAKDALNNYKESLNISAVDQAGNRVFVLDNNIDALNANLKKAQDTLAPTAAKFNELSNSLKDATVASLRFRSTTGTPDKKEEDLLKKRLEALEKIKAVTKDATALVGLQEAIFDVKVKIANRDDKKRLSKTEFDQLIKGLQNELNQAFLNQALEFEAIPKVKFSQVFKAEIPADIDSRIAKATGLDKKIPIITLHEVRVKILGVKLTEEIEFKEGLQKKLQDDLNSIVANLKVDAIATLAENIGDALVTGDIKNIFKSLFDVVANGLQQFGRALIAYGIAQKAFQLATRSLNPALAIAAGAGLIIAGAALKAALPKFATGGIINGPVIGQIGEMHRPEVILPLDRLPQMLRSIGGGGGNDMQLIPIINNEGLYLAVKRGERSAGRKF